MGSVCSLAWNVRLKRSEKKIVLMKRDGHTHCKQPGCMLSRQMPFSMCQLQFHHRLIITIVPA